MTVRTARAAAAFLAALLAAVSPARASSLKADEEVILFATGGRLSAGGGSWEVTVRGWVFEAEEDSLWRGEAVEELSEILGLDPREDGGQLFRRRARMFLVDSERGKLITVRAAGRSFAMEPTGPDGHFEGTAIVDRLKGDDGPGGTPLALEVATAAGDDRRFGGWALLLGPRGVSVISDIDDTVKASNVSNRKELLANTFLRVFREVPGMPETYRRWAEDGAAFHYLSASPWQLYPDLAGFLEERGFPPGSVHLRLFRLKGATALDFFRPPLEHKRGEIEKLLAAYPKRSFVLVGDSTESDPEIYADVARAHPKQVARILIRDLSPPGEGTARFDAAFEGVAEGVWALFREPSDLPRLPRPD